MNLTNGEAKRLEILRAACPEIAARNGVDSRDLEERFEKNCQKNGIPGSVGRGKGTLKILARELQAQ